MVDNLYYFDIMHNPLLQNYQCYIPFHKKQLKLKFNGGCFEIKFERQWYETKNADSNRKN